MYDAPGLMLSQIMQGTLTTRGAWNDFFNRDALSVSERETIAQRMRSQAGSNPVVSALLETAMNPWVWAAFVTSPLGGRALAGGARSLHRVAPELSAFVRKGGSLLHSMGGASPTQVLGGAGSAEVFHDIGTVVNRLHAEEGAMLTTSDLMRKLGVDTLDVTAIGDPSKRASVQRLMDAVWVRKTGLDVAARQPIGTGAAVPVPAVFRKEAVDAVLDSVGSEVQDYLHGMDKAIKQRAIRSGGDEALLGEMRFRADPTKYVALQNHTKRSLLNQGMPTEVRESMGGKGVVSDDLIEDVRNGVISPEEFHAQAGAEIEARMGDFYFPRNQRVLVGGKTHMSGTWADAVEQSRLQRMRQAIRPASAQMVRDRPISDLHPDELRRLRDTFGTVEGEGSAKFESWLGTQQKKLDEAMAGEAPAFFEIINPDKALRKHFDQTALSYAMHAAPVSDAALFAQKEHYAALVERGIMPKPPKGYETFEKSISGKGAWEIHRPFLENADASMSPSGRWTNADMIYSDYVMMHENAYAQKMVGHHILPVLAGQRPEKLVVRAGMIQAKEAVRGFTNGLLGKALDEAGPHGAAVKNALLEWADDDVLRTNADEVSRHVAQYLSMTHQGLNPTSMLTNGLQMFGGTVPRYGLLNSARAWFESVKGMANYTGERLASGKLFIDDVEKMRLIEKHIPFASFADETGRGANLITVGPNPFELIEGAASGRTLASTRKSGYQRMVETFMKGFEKIEWMNRATTAGAVKNRLEELGVDIASREGRAMFLRDMRRGVEESDFVPSMMNQPMAFQSSNPELGGPLGPVFSNPMARQYLPFIYRATVGQFLTGPAFNAAERTWGITGVTTRGRASATVHDFLRMMSTSALVYEVGKATVGADLSRGLGFNSAIGLFGVEKMGFNDSPMFLPPVADIPIQLAMGIATDDLLRIQQSIPRLVPAGVALSRFTSIMGEQKWLPKTSGLQKTYADWEHPDERGLVPFFKGDGTLIGYEEPRSLLMKGLGVDMGAFNKVGAFDRFVLKNQGEILSYRKQAISQLMAGDMGGYEATRETFQKRFKVPLVITQTQMKQAQKLRDVPRIERVLDRLPSDVRGQYLKQAAVTDPTRFGITPEALVGGATSGQRGPRPSNVRLSPEALQAIQDAVGAQTASPVGRSQPFEAFTGFGR